MGVTKIFPQCGKIEAGGEGVAVEDEDGVGGDEGLDVAEGAAGAEGDGLAGEDDFKPVGGAGGEVGFEDVGEVAGGEQDASDAILLQPVELVFKKGTAGDGHEGLGQAGKLRGDARALAAEKNDRLRNHGERMPRGGGDVKWWRRRWMSRAIHSPN